MEQGLGHVPYVLEAEEYGQIKGILPLALVRSSLFGKFLVSMPYLNYGGVIAKDLETAYHLVDRAIELAERLNTRTLELRQEYELDHPGFISWRGKKVHMRLPCRTPSPTSGNNSTRRCGTRFARVRRPN